MELPEQAPRRFGVIAIRSGRQSQGEDPLDRPDLYQVGCSAELREVTPYSDGRYDIVTVGEERFRLLSIDEDAETPYLTGTVEFLPEPHGVEDPQQLRQLSERVGELFTDYRLRLRMEPTELPDDPRVVSYLVCAAMVLDLPERQSLLAEPSTGERLLSEISVLRRERALVSTFDSLPAVELSRGDYGTN